MVFTPRVAHGLPGIYNATPLTLTDGEGAAAALNSSGQLVTAAPTGTTANQVQGNVASAATDLGNPVKVGGKYNSTAPTFTNGQRGDLQIDTNGNLKSLISVGSSDYWPQYSRMDIGGGQLRTDPSGALMIDGYVSTDGGMGRVNFVGAATFVSPGTATFTNGSATVTGTGFTTADIHFGDYIKLGTDAESAWAQVFQISSDTQILLSLAYTGTGGTGTYNFSSFQTITGTGATISVASGQATIAAGTNTSATSLICRGGFSGSISFATSLSISQAVANQDIYVGLEANTVTPFKQFSRFHFSGTNNTQVVTETAYNPTTTPSASEIESNTVTLPAAVVSASINTYRIEQYADFVKFYVNDILVSKHTKRIPHTLTEGSTNPTGGTVSANIRVLNTGAVTNTNIVADYISVRSFGRLDTYQSFVETGLFPVNTALNPYSVHLTANGTTTPATSTVYISTIAISTITAGTTSTVTIQDKAGTPLKLVNALTTVVATTSPTIFTFHTPVKMTSGIDIITAGAAAATVDVWVTYFQ